MPKRTFKDKMTIGKGADEIDLYYFGRGHTNGDAWVVFPALRVVHAGDIFAGKSLPLIDDATTAAACCEIRDTLTKALQRHQERRHDHHRPQPTQMTWADLKEYADFNKDFVAWVQAELKAGKTPEQAAAEWKLPEKIQGLLVRPVAHAHVGGLAGTDRDAAEGNEEVDDWISRCCCPVVRPGRPASRRCGREDRARSPSRGS